MTITIDKAIENLEKEEEDTFLGSEKEWKDTLKLSIAALKQRQCEEEANDKVRAIVEGIFEKIEKYKASYIDKRFWHCKFWQAIKQDTLNKIKG